MSETSETAEPVICLYPGCDREAVDSPRKGENPMRQGPPPRYCDNEEHNAASTYQALKAQESQTSADQPA